MLAGLEDAPHAIEAEVAVLARDSAPDDPLDPRHRDRQPLGELLRRNVDGDVVAQPGKRDEH
jgi:hypothetical protein